MTDFCGTTKDGVRVRHGRTVWHPKATIANGAHKGKPLVLNAERYQGKTKALRGPVGKSATGCHWPLSECYAMLANMRRDHP